MKFMRKKVQRLIIGIVGMLGTSLACAEPTAFEWESTSGFLFSPDQAAIEEITGQVSFEVDGRYVVPGSMQGTFTYDPENAAPPTNFQTTWFYRDASLDWTSALEDDGGLVGMITGDAGQVIVRDGDGVPGGVDDLVNVQMCTFPSCSTGSTGFFVGDWQATNSSVVWIGEGFQDGIDLPSSLPPANAPIPLGIFTFFNPTRPEGPKNVSILTFGLDIREAVQVVDIDVKPGSEPNCFNVNGHGVIPVAILGDSNLDVANVDQGSLSFGGLGVGVRGNKFPMCGAEESNADAYLDLVCQFRDDSNAWTQGGGEAVLTGTLLDGTPIKGTDSICLTQ